VSDPWSGGNRQVSVLEALKTATAKVDRAFRNQPLVAADVRRTIATTYSGLGRVDEAAALARSALEAQKAALGEHNEEVAKTLGVLAGRVSAAETVRSGGHDGASGARDSTGPAPCAPPPRTTRAPSPR